MRVVPDGRQLHPLCRRLLAAGLLLASAAPAVHAGAVTDGSVGPARTTLSGNFTVPPSLGSTRGPNLFQSFQRFSIDKGESATFQSTDAAVRNVIVRVTGGQLSQFDGPLTLTAPAGATPGFWFMNPSGIAVGASGSFDVPGSLHLSTAPALQFADGSSWQATATGGTLSVADPRAFGFVAGVQAAPMVWTGGQAAAQAGDIELSAGSLSLSGALVYAPAGGIALAASGDVTVARGSELRAEYRSALAGQGKTISISGDNVQLSDAKVISLTEGPAATRGGAIAITAQRGFSLSGESQLAVYALGGGDAGTLGIDAASVLLAGPSDGSATAGIEAYGLGGAASAGQVLIKSKGAVEMRDGGYVAVGSEGSGAVGLIDIRSASLSIDGDSSGLFGQARSADLGAAAATAKSKGSGANIQVSASGELRVVNSGWITSDTDTSQPGGSIKLNAGSMVLGGLGSVQSNVGGEGRGGDIDIQVGGLLKIDSSAYVSTETNSAGAGGSIRITAASLQLSGGDSFISADTTGSAAGGPITLSAGVLRVQDGARVSAKASGTGAAGNLTLLGRDIAITAGGQLSTNTTAAGGFRADIQVGDSQTQTLTLDKAALSANTQGAADAGYISLRADSVNLSNSTVLSRSEGRGEAGYIKIDGKQITIAGGSVKAEAGEQTGGTAGFIQIGNGDTLSLTVRDAAQISVDTAGEAGSGDLLLQGGTVRVQGQSTLAARTSGSGVGGDLSVLGTDITLLDSTLSTASTAAMSGDSGLLIIGNRDGSTRTLTVSGAQVSSNTQGEGLAGQILLNAGVVSISGSRLQSQSDGLGDAGLIQVDGQRITLSDSKIVTDASAETGGIAGYIFLGNASTTALTLGAASEVRSLTAGAAKKGRIELTADTINIRGGSAVDASTSGPGKAGDVTLTAKILNLDNSTVKSSASDTATADAGKVIVRVSGAVTLRNESELLAYNDAEFAKNLPDASGVDLQAGSLLLDSSAVLADALGGANGGTIKLVVSGPTTLLNNSLLGTSAVFGNGGPVSLLSKGPLLLRNSQIYASVEGREFGSGGDVTVQAPTIVMQSAFIQANTLAEQFRNNVRFKGGDVSIITRLLLPDGSNLRLGGSDVEAFNPGSPAGLNVIQAAAPDGVSGQLSVTQPELSVAAALASLQAPKLGLGRLAYDLCEIPGQSSLSVLTRGALYPYAAAPMSPLGAGR